MKKITDKNYELKNAIISAAYILQYMHPVISFNFLNFKQLLLHLSISMSSFMFDVKFDVALQ